MTQHRNQLGNIKWIENGFYSLIFMLKRSYQQSSFHWNRTTTIKYEKKSEKKEQNENYLNINLHDLNLQISNINSYGLEISLI